MSRTITMLYLILLIITIVPSSCTHSHIRSENAAATTLPRHATVSKTRLDAHRTIEAALAAAPTLSNVRYYIHVEPGFYNERVIVCKNKTNIALIGAGASITKISWNRHVPDFPTFDSATVSVEGNGFLAMNISFENRAGDGSQAVAVLSTANRSAYYRCSFLGYQDTLYVRGNSQFFKECDIYGTVDFIFGDASAVFQSCNIFSREPRTITFTAQNKQLMEDDSGFVMQNCTLSVAPGLEDQRPLFNAYLGRPWSNFSTVIVMESYLDSIIQPSGWLYWENRTTDKLFYREFGNYGPGSSTNARVNWTGFEVVRQREELRRFTVAEFISGNQWIPETHIPYTSGFMRE